MEQQATPKSRKKNHLGLLILLIIVVGAAAALVALLFFKALSGSQNLPQNIVKQADFAIYYPQALPQNYTLNKHSTAYENNILFFSLSDQGKTISISEQAAPQNPPDLVELQKISPSFKRMDVPSGRAVIGVNGSTSQPIAIIETNTTLINISGTKNTPSDVINKIAQNLNSLPQ